MTDEVQKHLENSMYGTPSVNPDEQHKFLGTFRERIYLRLTLAQLQQVEKQKILALHLKDYPNSFILLNGNLSDSLQDEYIQLITNAKMKFTIVDTDLKQPDDSGLLVVAKEAVNENEINFDEKFKTVKVQKKPQKKSFWKNLFS